VLNEFFLEDLQVVEFFFSPVEREVRELPVKSSVRIKGDKEKKSYFGMVSK